MAKMITREQMEKYNAKMGNGFRLDMRSIMYHGLKEPVKQVNINDEQYIEFKFCYLDEKLDRYTKTGNKVPTLHISLWKNCGNGMAQSNGIGTWLTVGESVKRGTLSVLTKYTHEYSEKKLMDIAEHNMSQLKKSTVF